ncbi:hypothetical protein D3C85_1775030 [compost metagenome]
MQRLGIVRGKVGWWRDDAVHLAVEEPRQAEEDPQANGQQQWQRDQEFAHVRLPGSSLVNGL